MANDPDAKRLLWFIFAGSRGGLNRFRIISSLKETPLNINQLAKLLGLDYKAIQHHIKILEKNNLITKMGEKLMGVFFNKNPVSGLANGILFVQPSRLAKRSFSRET